MQSVNRARMNWFGVKTSLRRVLLLPGVNPLVLGIAQRLLPMAQACRLPVSRPYVEFAIPGADPVRMYEPDRCDVAKDLYWGHGRRRVPADQWAIEAAMALSRGADLFLDIGAYSALFALAVARANPALRSVAYEIVPENYLLMARNVAFNSLSGRVDPRLVGLGAEAGSIRMPVRAGLTQAPSSFSLQTRFAEGVDVPVSTLDREFAAFAGRAVFKLDVEGFEPEVLRGGAAFLARVRPDMICEVLVSADTGAELRAQLEPLGYRAWLFTDAGLRPHPEWKAARAGRDWLLSCETDAALAMRLGAVPLSA